MSKAEILTKRAILLSARMRFSPETQPIRDSTIDRFLEYGLFLVGSDEGVSTRDLEKLLKTTFTGGVKAVGRADFEKSLERLVNANRIVDKYARKGYHFLREIRAAHNPAT